MTEVWWLSMYKFEVIDTQSMVGGVNFSSIPLVNAFDDQPYLISAACNWHTETPTVSVKMSTAPSVGIGTYPNSLNIFGTPSNYKTFHILKSAFFVQAMERDDSSLSDLESKITKEMLGSLKYSIRVNRSRKQTLRYLKANFEEGITKARSSANDDDKIGEVDRIIIRRDHKDQILSIFDENESVNQSFKSYEKTFGGEGAEYKFYFTLYGKRISADTSEYVDRVGGPKPTPIITRSEPSDTSEPDALGDPVPSVPGDRVVVVEESSTGRNLRFQDTATLEIMSREGFVAAIKGGRYPKYYVRTVNGLPTPVSKPNANIADNLR